MATVKGDFDTIAKFKNRVAALPRVMAHQVARDAAPVLTSMALEAYDNAKTVYGDKRPTGTDGRKLSLTRTGLTKTAVRFVAIGTLIRCVLGTPYARYLIGQYGILPNGAIPYAWGQKLDEIVQRQRV